MDSETLRSILAGLADVAKAIREHTTEMRESEARINAVGATRQAEDHAAAAARTEPYNNAVQAIMEHMQEMEANTERRQIESEGRADHRLATMEARMRDRGL